MDRDPHAKACGKVKLPAHAQVSYYDYALDLILDADSPSTEILTDEQHELVESAAETLYGLIHVRCEDMPLLPTPCFVSVQGLSWRRTASYQHQKWGRREPVVRRST